MAPAIVSWGAGLGWFRLAGTPLNFMSSPVTRWIFTFAEIGELINDKLPKTPSRKVPPQFIARVVMGALAGATLGAPTTLSSAASSPEPSAPSSALSAELPSAEPWPRPSAKTFPPRFIEDAVAHLRRSLYSL